MTVQESTTKKYDTTIASASNAPVFVDVFAGCGGLSLGLMKAGWAGLFAIEKDAAAFKTLSKNLIDQDNNYRFTWPEWLPQEPLCVAETIVKYRDQLTKLAGKVDLLVGGPPCQGYSSAGRRDPKDPRNQLFESYLEVVRLIKPKIVLLENVRGITLDFDDVDAPEGHVNYASKLVTSFSEDYIVSSRMLDLSSFGVPQSRSRFFLIGIRKDYQVPAELLANPFETIEAERLRFLRLKGLNVPMTVKAAISDLEIKRNGTLPSTESKGFQAIAYKAPLTHYQQIMREKFDDAPTDTRLAKHRPAIIVRFTDMIKTCHADGRLNVTLSRETRTAYGLKKQAIRVLDPGQPAPTITSMPDDLIHYSEPRALTVRENARLQSFPDWFVFCGNYTTGGKRRRMEVPRFTQVANAVPPLAAEAIGRSLLCYVASASGVASTALDISITSSKVKPIILASSSKLSL